VQFGIGQLRFQGGVFSQQGIDPLGALGHLTSIPERTPTPG